MRVIIAGSRDFSDYQLLSDTMHSLFPDMDIEVVSGMARGADYLGYCFGKENGLVVHEMPARCLKHPQPEAKHWLLVTHN